MSYIKFLESWILMLNLLFIIMSIFCYKLIVKYNKSLDLHKEITKRLHRLCKMKDGKYDIKQFEYNCGVLDSIQEVLNTYLEFMGLINKKGDKNEKNR